MADERDRPWLFLSDHGSVLLSLAGDPTVEISQVARLVGTDEQDVRQILEDLVAEGYVVRTRDGPRTRYDINRKAHLRHPSFQDVEIGPLIDALQEAKGDVRAARGSR